MTSATRALSAAVDATGFSQNVGRPRSTAASVSAAWAGVAAATTTPSTPEDSSASTESTGVAPYLAATSADDVGPLVGDHQAVELRQVDQGLGVERADAAEPDHAEGGHGILRSFLAAQRDVEPLGEVVGQRGEHRVHLARRRQAADGLVAVEVGGERVALGGGDHRVEDLTRRPARSPHGAQGRVHGAHHRGAVQRLHSPPERRRHLQQVRHPPDVAGRVGAGTVVQRRVEEHGIALAQRHLDVVLGEVLDELGPVERHVAGGEPLRVRQ